MPVFRSSEDRACCSSNVWTGRAAGLPTVGTFTGRTSQWLESWSNAWTVPPCTPQAARQRSALSCVLLLPAPAAPAKLSRRLLSRPRSAPRRPRPAGRRAVTSFRHAPCLAAPGVPLRYRLPACAAPVTGRASSSLRSGTSRARCSVVGDVERPRHGNALPILAASPLARSPMPTPASAAVTQAAKPCRQCERVRRGRQLVRQRLRLFPRATVVHRP